MTYRPTQIEIGIANITKAAHPEDLGKETSELEVTIRNEFELFINRIKRKLQCPECEGSGTQQSPSNYGPCNYCDGTGIDPDVPSLNDVFEEEYRV